MHGHDHPEEHGHNEGHRHGRRHGRHGHHGRHGFGPSFRDGKGFPNREELLAKLERYQRDLEERTADVADMIRRLKTEETDSDSSTPSPSTTSV
jgi:hypothetical protein